MLRNFEGRNHTVVAVANPRLGVSVVLVMVIMLLSVKNQNVIKNKRKR